jgi:HSP20 family protein
MSKQVYACAPEDDIHAALTTMRKDRVRRLPAIDQEGRLRGIVSMNDIALHAGKFEGRKTIDLSYDERSYRQFMRSFKLPTSVDSTKIGAEFKEGILQVTLPKREDARPKQIEVKVK